MLRCGLILVGVLVAPVLLADLGGPQSLPAEDAAVDTVPQEPVVDESADDGLAGDDDRDEEWEGQEGSDEEGDDQDGSEDDGEGGDSDDEDDDENSEGEDDAGEDDGGAPTQLDAAADRPLACPALLVQDRVRRAAEPLRYGGVGLAAGGLLGVAVFGGVAWLQRAQAEDLLETSPAFGLVGADYVVRDPGSADVAAYRDHRSTSSVLQQIAWISLGATLAGIAVVASTFALEQMVGWDER